VVAAVCCCRRGPPLVRIRPRREYSGPRPPHGAYARILPIMPLACQEIGDRLWSSFAFFPVLTACGPTGFRFSRLRGHASGVPVGG
jgi:hypothetical protein